jgi:DNA-binding NarL/FixJ family response regulator
MPGLSKNPVRIILLDAHTLFRDGLRYILEARPGMVVTGDAGNMNDGIELITSQSPDIILLELNLEGLSETEIIPQLVKASGSARLILLTAINDQKVHQKAVEDGVVGVISKTQTSEILVKAIEKVHAGEVWIEHSLIANVLGRFSRNPPATIVDQETVSINSLSEREKEVVKLIGQGYKNKRISSELCISETTVRHHLTYGLVTTHRK